VFGPVGTGLPVPLPQHHIPEEQPAAPPRAPGRLQDAGGPSQPQHPVPAPATPSRSRKRQTKASFRKQHQSPYAAAADTSASGIQPEEMGAATADASAFKVPVELMAYRVTAAQCRAEYVQRELSCSSVSCMEDYCFGMMDPWDLPYSQRPDPLGSEVNTSLATEQQQRVRATATQWVSAAAQQTAPTRHHEVQLQPASLNTRPVTESFFPAAAAGLVVYEPFGGLCAGLEAVLRNGLPVHTYIYSDIDPTARAVAQHRLQLLQHRYPGLLPASAVQHAFTALPQDVWQVTPAQLQCLSAVLSRQWLVVGGWECQDLSAAGLCRGITGPRSSTLAALKQLLTCLQHCQPDLPPAYILENTAMQHNFNSAEIREVQYPIICQALGHPTCVDATQFDSLAHRVRNFWTNLCSPQQLQAAFSQVKRTPGLRVDSVIDPATGRQPAPVERDDDSRGGRYPANKVGQARSAWPTLMAFPTSRAFHPGQPGFMLDPSGGLPQPTAGEREAAMGYVRGDTGAPGVTEQQRREVLGRCIDANVLQSIVAVGAAWHRHHSWSSSSPSPIAAVSMAVHEQQLCPDRESAFLAAAAEYGPERTCRSLQTLYSAATAVSQLAAGDTTSPEAGPCLEQYLVTLAVAAVAEATERDSPDIWLDKEAMHYLQHQEFEAHWVSATRTRVRKRAAKYQYTGDGQVKRLFPDGSARIVPKPEQRADLMSQFHQRSGHFGVRRTGALISNSYWWWGLWGDVAAHLSKCSLCSRVRSSFNGVQPDLQPLPISGLMYRWGVDLCGPFPATGRGNQYILVAVEHYSKHLELVPISNKEPATTAAALAAAVLGRYGSPAELVTDRGGEWMKEFEQLLLDCMIDHRHTSASHPAAVRAVCGHYQAGPQQAVC
jgi:hypothetical protein